MRYTQTLAIILAVLVLMGVACTRTKKPPPIDPPFNGGIEGLTAEFEEIGTVSDTGPDNEVWEDEEFPLTVHLQNKGEYDLEAHTVELEIKGISPDDFSGIDFTKDNQNKIEKVSEFLPEGGEEWVDFGDAKYNNLIGTHYDAAIFIYFVYKYRTQISVPQVCYKEDLKDNTVCEVDATKRAFASGGPFAVGTVEQRFIGKGKILLEIPIKNVGKGRSKPYKNDDFEPNFDEFVFKTPDPDWDCSARGNPSIGRITHPSGQPGNEEVVVRCVNEDLEDGALYVKPFELVLEYFYQDWISQIVRIREQPE